MNSGKKNLNSVKIEYENQDLLIVNKPADLPVYSTKKRMAEESVVSFLIQTHPGIREVGDFERPGIVHRLDRQTSGLLAVAKTKDGFEFLKNLFRSREIIKEYLALVYGQLPKHGVIKKPLTKIGVRGSSRVRVDAAGKEAVTEYWALGYYNFQPLSSSPLARGESRFVDFPPLERGGKKGEVDSLDCFTLVRVKLHTGRTHQIRVHFSSEGHPVMGDNLYGKPQSQKLHSILNRQFLHASRLELRLADGTWLEVESELPEDLQKVLEYLSKIPAEAGIQKNGPLTSRG